MYLDESVAEPGKNIFIFATCHGWLVRHALKGFSPHFKNGSAVHFLESFQRMAEPLLPKLSDCDYFFFQAETAPDVLANYEFLVQRLPQPAKVVRFPMLSFTPFWPFAFHDYGAPKDPVNGVARFPMGDRRIIQMLRRGMPADEVVDAYLALDVPTLLDLDRIMEVWKENFQTMEKDCDVHIMDYIDERVRREMTFFWPTHCANKVIFTMMDRLLNKLGFGGLDAAAFIVPDSLHDWELPIHPSVVRHFEIEYVIPNQQYLVTSGERASIDQYYNRYVRYLIDDRPELLASRSSG